MNTNTPGQGSQAVLALKAAEIDKIAERAMGLFQGSGKMSEALAVAQCIEDMRGVLTPEVMAPIMALMNTPLGFMTDRDPRRPKWDRKEGRYVDVKPYPMEIVREVFIESQLRGFWPFGDEFNIIAERFYAAKNGLKRRCETWPKVTKLKIVVGIPHMKEGGAICNVLGTWEKEGVADRIETEVAIRVNEGMGADAITGKAERKLYKRIFDRLSGKVIEDGDLDEALSPDPEKTLPPPPPDTPPAENNPPPSRQTAPRKHKPPTPPEAEATTVQASQIGVASPEKLQAAVEKSVDAGTSQTASAKPFALEPMMTPSQIELAGIVTKAGFSFDEFRKWVPEAVGNGNAKSGFIAAETWGSWLDMPEKAVQFFITAQAGMINGLKATREKG